MSELTQFPDDFEFSKNEATVVIFSLNNEIYKKIVEKFDRVIRSKVKSRSGFKDYYKSGPFADLKRRYKSHYWLSDLLEDLNKDKN